MRKENWDIITKIADELLECSADIREQKLGQLCAGDGALKTEVLAHLKNIERSESFWTHSINNNLKLISQTGSDMNVFQKDPEIIGTQLGPYRITGLIGTGGMGLVYRAERSDGTFERTVAIKAIPLSLHFDHLRKRFLREQQILGRLTHPGIAQLFDAGVADAGFPYLVMEYIDGTDILNYVCEQKKSIAEKLNLFCSVCLPVEYAHQQLIVHRDLKPSNILVTEDGTVKVLDFGISKLLEESEVNEQELLTRAQLNLFTLRYAAPEQIEHKAATTTTDVYALGILLYEILKGSHPFDLDGKDRRTSEQYLLDTDLPPLGPEFPRDLDAIIQKATRKEPDKRYSSIRELREDIERYLNKKPVLAQPVTALYRFSKFVRRNRTLLTATAAVLIMFLFLSAFYIQNITVERTIAQEQSRRALAIQNYLVDIFRRNDPVENSGADFTLVDFLNRSIAGLEEFGDSPEIEAEAAVTIGRIAQHIQEYPTAISLYERAYQLRDSLQIANSNEQARLLNQIGENHVQNGDHRKAVPVFYKALNTEHITDETEFYVRLNLGEAYAHIDQFDSAYLYLDTADSLFNEDEGQEHASDLLIAFSEVLRETGELEEAEQVSKELIRMYTREEPLDTLKLSIEYNNLAYTQSKNQHYADAIQSYQKAIDLREAYFETYDHNTSIMRQNLGTTYIHAGKTDQAITVARENLKMIRDHYGSTHWRTGNAHHFLSRLFNDSGELENSLMHQRICLGIYKEALSENHLWTLRASLQEAVILRELGREGAMSQFTSALETIRSVRENPLSYYDKSSFAELSKELEEKGFSEFQARLEEFIEWHDCTFE